MHQIPVAILGSGTPLGRECQRVFSAHPGLKLVAIADFKQSTAHDIHNTSDSTLRSRSAQDLLRFASTSDLEYLIVTLDAFDALELWRAQEYRKLVEGDTCRILDATGLATPCPHGLFKAYWPDRHPAFDLVKQFTYASRLTALQELSSDVRRIACPSSIAQALELLAAPILAVLPEGAYTAHATVASSASALRVQPGSTPELVRQTRVCEMFEAIEAALWLSTPRRVVEFAMAPIVVPQGRGTLLTLFLPLPEDLTLRSVDQYYREFFSQRVFEQLLEGPLSTADHIQSPIASATIKVVNQTLVASCAYDELAWGGSGTITQLLNCLAGFPEDAGLPIV